ncbi:hypothetical protein F4819DRAFT_479949 [Hypoxylon fuscum]|nr:hypothetical protein F4819DRAFT_479949 [Hypoxylon fuscum]
MFPVPPYLIRESCPPSLISPLAHIPLPPCDRSLLIVRRASLQSTMGYGISQNSVYGAIFVLSVVTTPLCILATTLRFAATLRARRKINREDWCAFGALVIHLVYIALSLVILHVVDGRDFSLFSTDELLFYGKLVYATSPLFVVNQFFAKFSILFLYHRLFGVNRNFVRWIQLIGFIHVAWCIATLCIYLFSCQPISKGWDLLRDGTCVNYLSTVAGCESINSAVDFSLVIAALFMIRPLRMKTSTKWKLAAIFAVGGLAGIVGFVKIGEAYAANDPTHLIIGAWAIAQMACSIICCCAPTYKNVLPTDGFFIRLVSHITNYSRSARSSRSRVYRSSNPSSSRERMANKSNESNSIARQDWPPLGESSQRGFAWTEVDADPEHGTINESGYPMKTVSVRQNVETA